MTVSFRHRSSQQFPVMSLSSHPVGGALTVTVGLLLLLLAGPTSVCAAPVQRIVLRGSPSEQMSELGDLLAAVGPGTSGAAGGGMMPRRPDNFRNLEELNQYMAEMRQFYSMLSRPRSVK